MMLAAKNPVKRTKIAIFGLLPRQEAIVEKKIGSKFKFSFYENRKRDYSLSGQDCVFVLGNFTKHSIVKGIQKFYSSGPIVIHHGGVEKLIKRIESEIL